MGKLNKSGIISDRIRYESKKRENEMGIIPKPSIRTVVKRYNTLMNDVECNDFYKIDLTNRVNCYVCDCGHITKTKDVDAGVTPFMHTCEKCCNLARSTFYNDIIPEQQPTQEWYRPTLKQLLKMRNNIDLFEHVLNGGLDVRKIK